MNAHTWVSLHLGKHRTRARARTRMANLDPAFVNALVREPVCVFRSTFAWFSMFVFVFFCFAVFESFAILLRFYCSMFSLFVWVCVFSFVFSCVHCSLFFIWFLLLPVVFIFLRESFAVLEQCYSTAFFLKVTDFFYFNFTFFSLMFTT